MFLLTGKRFVKLIKTAPKATQNSVPRSGNSPEEKAKAHRSLKSPPGSACFVILPVSHRIAATESINSSLQRMFLSKKRPVANKTTGTRLGISLFL